MTTEHCGIGISVLRVEDSVSTERDTFFWNSVREGFRVPHPQLKPVAS